MNQSSASKTAHPPLKNLIFELTWILNPDEALFSYSMNLPFFSNHLQPELNENIEKDIDPGLDKADQSQARFR